MSYSIKQNSAVTLVFLMISSSDHISPATGLSPTVVLSKNGGTFAAAAGVVTEIGNGWYAVAADALNSNTLGPLILHATAATADPTDFLMLVVDGLVDLGPEQHTTIIGNIQGAVGSVTDPVTCLPSSSNNCRRRRCGCC